MTRIFLTALWIAFAGTTCFAQKAKEPQRPNVVVVLTDDQGYGDLGCHGNPILKTPQIDALAAECIRLTDFHVAPMCTPTRGQLMTGQDAVRNGAYCVCSGRTFIRPGTPTMADVFAAAGYRTAIFGKWHLGDNAPQRPMDRGFQEALYHLGWGITSTPDFWNNDYFDDTFRHNGRLKQCPGYCTDVWFEAADRWIRRRAAAREPFLVYLSLNAPHGPFFVPPAYRRLYSDRLDHETAGFFGMIANIDENVGKLDRLLGELGLRDDTILVFMTDNGGTGGVKVYNARMRGAKASLYDGGHRVPCFIRWPKGNLRPAGDVGHLAQVQDILPTLAELCAIRPDETWRFDGTSLVPLLRGKAQPELDQRRLVVQYGGLSSASPAKWDAVVLWQQWRLVNGRELYDVGCDPGQERDVAAEFPGIVAWLRERYETWWADVEPLAGDFTPISIGSPLENPTCLSSMDWLAPGLTPAAQDYDVRQLGEAKTAIDALPGGRPKVLLNGPWLVRVEQAGQYEIGLRRWPREADAPIAAGLPPYQAVDGRFPEGVALPIARAKLRVGPIEQSRPVSGKDKEVTFRVTLPAGKTTLHSWFLDASGKEICGAFYVYVKRL